MSYGPWPEASLPVDKDWLIKIVNSKCPDSMGKLKNYSCTQTPPGLGYVSVITRVVFEWDDVASSGVSGLPKGVIVKVPTATKIGQLSDTMNEIFKDRSTLAKIHNQEVAAYNYFNSEHFVGPPPVPLAKCFYTEEMTETNNGMIILDDLTDVARNLGNEEPMSKEQLFTLIDHYANLQAFGFINPNYKEHMSSDVKIRMKHIMEKQFDGMVTQMKKILPTFAHSADWFTEILHKATTDYDIEKQVAEQGYTTVLSLGDCNPSNILWEKDPVDPSKITAKVVAFIDLQITGPGDAGNDIANAMLYKHSTDGRRSLENEVIAVFYEKLTALVKADGNGECPLSIDEVKKLYRKQLCLLSLGILPMVVNMVGKLSIPEEHLAPLFDMFVSAVEDLDRPWE